MSFLLLGVVNSQAAGGGATGFDLLESTILSSNASSVTFSNLNTYSDYKHLQIRAVMRTSTSSDGTHLVFNSDTTSSYSFHQLRASGDGDVYYAPTNSAARIEVGQQIDGDDTFAAWPAIVDIMDFANTSKNTTIRAYSNSSGFTAGIISYTSGVYRKTDAITSLTFSIPNALRPFGTNTRFSLYGMKG